MFRSSLLVAAALSIWAIAVPASAQVPARFANSKNVKLFFDDELLKAARTELESAHLYEAEALARVIADCDVAPIMAVTPEACARSVNYFLVVNSPGNGALPRLIMAMGVAAREMRLHEAGADDPDQKRAFARWAKVQGELAGAARGRLQALSKDREKN
jgi:hypothetical protein